MKTVYIIDMIVIVCLIQILIGSSYGLLQTSLGNQSINNTSSSKLTTVRITITSTKPSTIENRTGSETNATTEEGILITISSTAENGTRSKIYATTEERILITISSTKENGTTIETNVATEEETPIAIFQTRENETTTETNVATEEETPITIPSTTEKEALACSSQVALPTTTPATIPEKKTLDPYCPPKYCLSHTTYKCELHYEWVIKDEKSVRDSRLVNIQEPKDILSLTAIARLVDAVGNEFPCYVAMRDFGEVLASNCFTAYPDNFKVLFMNCGNYKWIKPLNGTVPENAIVGGKIGNDTSYVCRLDGLYIGWVYAQPSSRICYAYEYSTSLHAESQEYELLVYSN